MGPFIINVTIGAEGPVIKRITVPPKRFTLTGAEGPVIERNYRST